MEFQIKIKEKYRNIILMLICVLKIRTTWAYLSLKFKFYLNVVLIKNKK